MINPIKYPIALAITLALAPLSALHSAEAPRPGAKPNILIIITDQQHAGMMSCVGNSRLKTPNMDRLAAEGVRFERAYCANPVCMPSRISMFTGQPTSVAGLEFNDKKPSRPMPATTMGSIFRASGYRTVYGGKRHLSAWDYPDVDGKIGTNNYGFDEYLTTDEREKLAESCAQLFKQKQERPFLLVASFINPHDICFMAIQASMAAQAGKVKEGFTGYERFFEIHFGVKLPTGVALDEFIEKNCPPLPANFEIPENEPKLPGISGFRTYARKEWTEKDWRLHQWAYARLTEKVDREIGLVLNGLRESGLAENTLVVFTSDHGDMDSAHRLEHKSMPYEEAMRIPLIFSGRGVTRAGAVDREHLVSNGLDLIPSLCDFAGIAAPPALKGRSVRELVTGDASPDWRKTLAIENQKMRILHMGDSKYGVVAYGGIRELFFDLAKDPGEMRNVADDPAYKAQVEEGRKLLKEWYATHGFDLEPHYKVENSAHAHH